MELPCEHCGGKGKVAGNDGLARTIIPVDCFYCEGRGWVKLPEIHIPVLKHVKEGGCIISWVRRDGKTFISQTGTTSREMAHWGLRRELFKRNIFEPNCVVRIVKLKGG